ncbi:proprotein convertase P-domain-containing protein [Tahibacter amnicola]|uniref:Proprotein convertase P-domain-containing protein n=1 Tax=Tahibacter amnicola TaxID=2976241 RepID=A0ABY6B6Y1_9GAMM|nr:proprotein convertase P-domain-containing protein [Tahibacter amnicola]UXI65858.1 proprotein convertase P-domain-containing protein [Tahibacter amnicola]
MISRNRGRLPLALAIAGIVASFPGVATSATADAALSDALVTEKLYVLPAPDTSKMDTADGAKGKPFQYGVVIPQKIDALARSLGTWEDLGKKDARWRWTVASPGAQALEFQFSRLRLPKGAVLTLRGADDSAVRTITADDLANPYFRTAYVPGERVTLQLDVTQDARYFVEMALESVTHAYRLPFGQEGMAIRSASCNVDVACTSGNQTQNQIASVGHYTFLDGGLSYVCTGTLMANTSMDGRPFFLTANHCLEQEVVADTVVVYWNYESATCRVPGSAASGTALGKIYATHTQSGATLRATYGPTDFTLLELDTDAPRNALPFFAGWDRSAGMPTSTYTIHHPNGDEKRISRDYNAPAPSGYYLAANVGSSHIRVADWDSGTTEGGSSGAPLFNPSGRVIGQLHGGNAACGNNSPDWFGRLAESWIGGGNAGSRLRDWLDPINSNVLSMSGHHGGTKYQNTTDTGIPDNNTPVDVTINVPAVGNAGNVGPNSSIRVRIQHTYIGDLEVKLIAPDGDTYLLRNLAGGSSDNLHEIYLKNLSGSPKAGAWKLRVTDKSPGDSGWVDYFGLGGTGWN